jgi:RNA polymerase sigma factor (TIGR02999 family)
MREYRLDPSADFERVEGKSMSAERRGDLTALLGEVHVGDDDAKDRLVRAIYAELRRIAGGLMHHERPGHTLQPSALVHEALMRLLDGEALAEVPNRRYLFAAAAQAMRQVLVDHARRRGANKREGGRARVPLDEALVALEEQGLDVLALHEALDCLAQAHPRPAQVVTLRFFGGLSVPEVAEAMGVSDTTVESDWRFARAWLKGQLGGSQR